MSNKVDFKKELKHLYRPSAKDFEVVDVPTMSFLMIDGRGDPNTAQGYKDAVEALYAVAYRLKFMSKKDLGRDYVVPPLEGLWWVEHMEEFSTDDKSAWDWTMMVMQPAWITQEMFEQAVGQVEKKKKNLSALPKLRLERHHEGLAVQIMHIGPYDAEAPTIARMHAFIAESGYEAAGKHHEIYLGDPRRVAPEKLRTVLRQPIRRMNK
jgi:hypothetical protein